MPYYQFREFWTPLKVFGVRFFREADGKIWVKVRARERRPLF
jgi:hypothetical protein